MSEPGKSRSRRDDGPVAFPTGKDSGSVTSFSQADAGAVTRARIASLGMQPADLL